jgi:hypothetical protein
MDNRLEILEAVCYYSESEEGKAGPGWKAL